MNIGRSIREVMKKRGMSATRLAREIPCERTNVYNIFGRKDISTKLLWRISEVLDHNFFEEFSKEFTKGQNKRK
jgi:plasmid maintenance system antidote protein VapI